MKLLFKFTLLLFFIISCKPLNTSAVDLNDDLVIAFGSCNKQYITNVLWKPIIANQPNVWVWGGDVVYADTDDMTKLKKVYDKQLQNKEYQKLTASTKILGTWDDHDYGLNDGGEAFHAKIESQQLFLDFIGVSKNNKRRQREGIYHSEIIKTSGGTVKIIVLDTRYFRTALTPLKGEKTRYTAGVYGEGTILGAEQWQWLTKELINSEADFNVIVSSIQFLSNEHHFETWGNFPHEVDKLKLIIAGTEAKGVIILSGDRHISEFSKTKVEDLAYPLIDFTSSGLTHAYTSYDNEPNMFRVGDVVSKVSFGLLKFDFKSKTVRMEIRGKENRKLQALIQRY